MTTPLRAQAICRPEYTGLRILAAVSQAGSVQAASRALGVCHRQLWRLIDLLGIRDKVAAVAPPGGPYTPERMRGLRGRRRQADSDGGAHPGDSETHAADSGRR